MACSGCSSPVVHVGERELAVLGRAGVSASATASRPPWVPSTPTSTFSNILSSLDRCRAMLGARAGARPVDAPRHRRGRFLRMARARRSCGASADRAGRSMGRDARANDAVARPRRRAPRRARSRPAPADAARQARLAGVAGARRARHARARRPAGRRRTGGRGFLWFVLALLALNWLSCCSFQPGNGEQRVTVPFSPYFLEQVKAGQVKSISSKGNTVEGKFKTKLRYPASDKRRPRRRCSRPRCRRSGTAASCRRCCRKSASRSTPNRPERDRRCWPSCCSASARRC